jgi:hypothetical protein
MKIAMLAALAALSALAAGDTLRADVYPRTLLKGGAVRLTCHVPRDADHRWLDLGIDGLRTSGIQLDGESEKMTFPMLIEHVPCGVEEAFCLVQGATGQPQRAVARFIVAGCED